VSEQVDRKVLLLCPVTAHYCADKERKKERKKQTNKQTNGTRDYEYTKATER
jgi:hypothetical protein